MTAVKERRCAAQGRIFRYIIPKLLSERYSDIVSYGIRIEMIDPGEGGQRSIASEQLDNVFFRYEDAAAFMEYAARSGTAPGRLKEAVEDFSKERLGTGAR